MLNLNKFLNYKILLALVIANNALADAPKQELGNSIFQLNQQQIANELQSIVKLEHKNLTLRKVGYAAVSAGVSYYLFKGYFLKNNNNLPVLSPEELKNKNQALKEFANFINGSKSRIVNPYTSKFFGRFEGMFNLSTQLTDEENLQLLAFLKAASEVKPKQGYIRGFFSGIWGLGTSIGFQLALGATIAWTGKNFYKHFMPLSYEYFITHHTNFEQALEMVNSCTLLDPEKAQDPLYVELSKENLKLAYSRLIKDGQKIIAYMLYTKIKNKNLVQGSRTILDNLTENFKNNLSDISNFIETHNLLAIRNRVSAINNTSKMFINFETVLEN